MCNLLRAGICLFSSITAASVSIAFAVKVVAPYLLV
jgi:hypothetical protein